MGKQPRGHVAFFMVNFAQKPEAIPSITHSEDVRSVLAMKKRFVILVAEDDSKDRELLLHAARANGQDFELHLTHDGEEALSYLKGSGRFSNRSLHPFPDLLLLDLKMPRVNGLEVLNWVRQRSGHPRIPMVMLSGSGLEHDVEEAYRLGINTYFTKPDSLKELRELIDAMVAYWSRSQRPF